MTGRALVDALLSTLLAPPCASCTRVLDHPLDGAVCARCWDRIAFITPPVCESCGAPLPSWRVASCAGGKCPRCRRLPLALDRVRAIGPYRDELRAIVHALKYGGRQTVARRLGALMRDAGADVLSGADAVVPVPLHPRRRRQRGFNQAALLASHLGLPLHEALRRVVHTQPQVELAAARRHKNVRDAFQVVAGGSKDPPLPLVGTERAETVRLSPVEAGLAGVPSAAAALGWKIRLPWRTRLPRVRAVEGKVLVLVDDVITTGATLDACARALKAAGAREVRALTAARVVSERPQESGL